MLRCTMYSLPPAACCLHYRVCSNAHANKRCLPHAPAGRTGILDSSTPISIMPVDPLPAPVPAPPAQTFELGSARFAFFPLAASSSANEALAQCRTWSTTSQLLWWDSLQELQAITAGLTLAEGVRPLISTDLLCKAGASTVAGDNTPPVAYCLRLSTGAPVREDLLTWYTVLNNLDESAFSFTPLVYLQPGSQPNVLMGLVGAPEGMLQSAVLCRDGGEGPLAES